MSSDEKFARNYIRNLNIYKKRSGGSIRPEDYKTITNSFERQIRDNCNCPTKNNGKRTIKLCDCKDDKR
jgi:hypothetical protein